MIEDNKNSDKNQEINLREFVFFIIKELPKRSEDIIVKRFNLNGNGAKTLNEIGKEHQITRERVRQIEAEAIAKLRIIGKKYDINSIFDNIKKIIKDHGDIISEEEIIKHLFKTESRDKINKQAALLVLSLDDKIKTAKETKACKKIYFYEKEGFEKFCRAIEILEKYLLESNKTLTFEKILSLLKDKNFAFSSRDFIVSYLSFNKIILQNIIGEWGHQKWSYINPGSVRDKSYLVLRKNKKPLHFTKITDEVNEIWKNKKKHGRQIIHNELIKDERFVLIGRGIYALAEWGYKHGTVLDVLLEIFGEAGKKISQDEIIEKVLEKRIIKKNTIILNLHNKKYFEKLENKVYRLK